jgi:hypothetical protein
MACSLTTTSIQLMSFFSCFKVENRALEDSVRVLTKFDDMKSSFSLDDVFR